MKLKVFYTEGKTSTINSLKLDKNNSDKLFKRTGEINKIIVFINK